MATEVGSDIALIQDEDMLRKMVIYFKLILNETL